MVTQQILVPSVDAVEDRRGGVPAGEGFLVGVLMGPASLSRAEPRMGRATQNRGFGHLVDRI
jgi:hypothetical protein